MTSWTEIRAEAPLIAILRGVTPHEAVEMGEALYEGGLRCVEVPLNSPQPFDSIAALAAHFSHRMLVGAGTVMNAAEVDQVASAGGALIVSPHCDGAVIAAAKGWGIVSLPGFFTATEAFSAIRAGADGLKLFPADAAGSAYVRALKAVLPREVPVFAVGGVDRDSIGDYVAAGADGFGLGSALYKPGFRAREVRERAIAFMDAFKAARG